MMQWQTHQQSSGSPLLSGKSVGCRPRRAVLSNPLIVHHNLVMSVLWSSDVALVISSFIVDSRENAGSCLRRSLALLSWPGYPLGLAACIAYVFQCGYDINQP